MRLEKLHASLLDFLRSSLSPGDRAGMLGLLQQWLKSQLSNWSTELRERWGLDGFAAMDLLRYPMDEASLDPEEELRQLQSVPPASMEIFAMRLRDIFWSGLTVASTVLCPRCGETRLRILGDAASEHIVLSCDLCSWSQTPRGEPWRGTRNLLPVTTDRLRKSRAGGA